MIPIASEELRNKLIEELAKKLGTDAKTIQCFLIDWALAHTLKQIVERITHVQKSIDLGGISPDEFIECLVKELDESEDDISYVADREYTC